MVSLSEGEERILFCCVSRVCLEAEMYRYWTIGNCHALRVLSKGVKDGLERMEYHLVRQAGGAPAFVAFPGYLGLKSGLFRHQLASLSAMHYAEYSVGTTYGALRGGVLGDAPGLGKSVTLLAHVLASAGEMPVAPAEFWNKKRVDESWESLGKMEGGSVVRPDVLKGLRSLIAHRNSMYRGTKSWAVANELLDTAQNRIGSFKTPDDLERHVKFSVAKLDTSPAGRDTIASDFSHAISLAKAKLDKSHRAALRQQKQSLQMRLMAERVARPSGATLCVVPDALLGHWRRMIERHVDLSVLAPNYGDGQGYGIVYVEGFGDAATWTRAPAGEDGLLDGFDNEDNAGVVEAPAIGNSFPGADELRGYLIVVVSFSLVGREAAREAARNKAGALQYTHYGEASTADRSQLLQLRWLRLVVDEGHDLGAADAPTSFAASAHTHSNNNAALGPMSLRASAMLSTIFAERRWILSGTPVVGDVDDPAATRRHLDQLSNLLRWLRHERYGIEKDPGLDGSEEIASSRKACLDRWESEIARPFLDENDDEAFENARNRLVDLLRGLFVRHKKEDIRLPKPVFVNTELEVKAKGPDESEEDFQWRVDQTLGDYVVKRVSEADKAGGGVGRGPKMAVFSQHDGDLQSVAEVLYRRIGESRVAEFAVRNLGSAVASRELTRFSRGRRLVRTCPVCGGINDDVRRVCSRTLLEVELLDADVVESRAQSIAAFAGDLQPGPKSAERLLVEAERVVRVVRAAQPDVNGVDGDTYVKNYRSWTLGDELVVSCLSSGEHFRKRPSLGEWVRWGAARCESLAARDQYENQHWYFAPLFIDDHRSTVRCRLRKWGKCGSFHGAQWYHGPALWAAPTTIIKERVPLLCLYRDASHGLDLSFLDAIFLLEPVQDSALLEQVVSRAYRVGATKPVVVETLYVFLGDESPDPSTSSLHKYQKGGWKQRDKRYICDHCFKSFRSSQVADDHMLTCSRNPELRGQTAGHRSIASVFDELRPPS